MTGRQLKEFAAQVHDESIIEVREAAYETWNQEFELQAPYVYKVPKIIVPVIQQNNSLDEKKIGEHP